MTKSPYAPLKGDLYRTVFSLIRHKGDTTRQYLTDMTGLASTSLNRVLDRLMVDGWIKESGLADSTGGRRPNLYCQNDNAKYFLIIWPEERHTTLYLLNIALEVRYKAILPVIAADSKNNDDEKHPEIWLQLFEDNISEMELENPECLSKMAGLCFILNSEGKENIDLNFIVDYFNLTLKQDNFIIKNISSADSRFYSALWKAKTDIDESMVFLSADYDISYIGVADKGLRHADKLQTISANNMLVPSISADKPVPINKNATKSGLLKRFCRLKQDKNLGWSDFVTAAMEKKKKAEQIINECAIAFAMTIYNTAYLIDADYWHFEGQLLEDLPMLTEEISMQLLNMSKKTKKNFKCLSFEKSDFEESVASGGAACLLEAALEYFE